MALIEEALTDEQACYVDLIYVGLANHDDVRLSAEIDTAEWFCSDQIKRLETTFPIKQLAGHVLERTVALRDTLASERTRGIDAAPHL